MFSFLLVCLFFCLLAGLRENNSPNFHKILWKRGIKPRKKSLDFDGNPVHMTLRLALGRVMVTVR